jgi:hypothetical protein
VRSTRRLTAFRTPSIAGLDLERAPFVPSLWLTQRMRFFARVVFFIGPSPSWPASPPILRRDMQDCLHHGPYRFRASHWCGLLPANLGITSGLPRVGEGLLGLGSGPQLIASSPVA